MHRVAVLLLPPVVGFDATIPPQLLGSAVDESGRELYDVTTVGLGREPVPTRSGYAVVPAAGPEALAEAETVIVPGTGFAPAWSGDFDPALRTALAVVRPGTRMVSICTGAFVLASAGLLDGRPATTHWRYAENFRRRYPRVLLDEDRLFVDDGEVLTSAGLAAGIDLCLHLIRRDHGAAVANHVARRNVVPAWRDGGQAQFIERPMPRERGGERLGPLIDWLRANLARPHSIEAIAARSGMSPRTFQRRFEAATGLPPGEWLAAERVGLAREHLERRAGTPLADIAEACGFGTVETMRHHFRRRVGISPGAYRARFSA